MITCAQWDIAPKELDNRPTVLEYSYLHNGLNSLVTAYRVVDEFNKITHNSIGFDEFLTL